MPRPASARKSQPARRAGRRQADAAKTRRRQARAEDAPRRKPRGDRGDGARRSAARPPRARRRAASARPSEQVAARRRAAPTPAESAGSASRGKYVYCIIESAEPLRFGADRHRRRSVGRLHRALQEPRGGGLRRAARGARLDARERARARARQRDGDARAHRHPDVVRHRSSRPARTSSSCCARPPRRSATC